MKISPSKENVNSHFSGHWSDFYSRFMEIKSTAGKYNKCLCPFHEDGDPSLSFNSETGAWRCFGCDASGDAFKFYGLLKNISSFPEILQGIGQEFNVPVSGNGSGSTKAKKSSTKSSEQSKIVAEYNYTDESGPLLYQSVRFDPKDFRQRRPDEKGGWIWDMQGVERVLYRLPEVLQAVMVLIVEGEKDADVLREKGFTATTNVGGAGKWDGSYSQTLAEKDVVILPDKDDPGRKHAQKVAASLNGVARSVKVLELPGLPEKGDVSDWIEAGGSKDELEKLIAECPPWEPEEYPSAETMRRFPRGPFPWSVLPASIAESLKQLARSCATSATSLPGAAIAILASVVGSVVSVSPKLSWIEPLIFWIMDIRFSGEGKTHAPRSLCRVLYEMQTQVDEEFKAAFEQWQAMPKKDRGQPPPRPRGYFVTNLTLEGLREDHSGHGGKVCILDELSAFISGQNEYKQKGSDRESWLCLHDGQPARIVRAGRSVTLSGARISIFGGIQPQVWKRCFSSDGDLFLVDGTVFRFLPVYEGSAFYPLTAESWSDENKDVWESLLKTAMRWSDSLQEAKERKILCLSQDAQEAFLNWRNELVMMSGDLPPVMRGFIPKLVGYALRLAGVLYLMDTFSMDQEPGSILNVDDIRKGITVSEFYLGHIIQAMELIASEDAPELFEVTDQVRHLAKTLAGLKGDRDNGRLAIGYIQERFDEGVERDLRVNNSRLMGSLLRKCGLTITGGRYRANGKTGVYCLVWDQKTDSFIESMSTSPSSPQNGQGSGSKVMEEESPQVHQVHQEDQPVDEMMDMMEEGNPKSIKQEPYSERFCGHDGHDGGVFYNPEENEPPEYVEI